MRKFLFPSLTIVMLLLAACGGTVEQEDQQPKEKGSTEQQQETETAEKKEESKSATLPDTFPSDFPIPETFKITEVQDTSDNDRAKFTIRFTFDPALDLQPIFDMYDDYSNQLGYNILIGGEAFFAEGIFQYGAHDPKSANNMFVVTLQEGGDFGSIDYSKEK